MKSLQILNSAKNEKEKKYYLEALTHAQKGLKLGRYLNNLQFKIFILFFIFMNFKNLFTKQ